MFSPLKLIFACLYHLQIHRITRYINRKKIIILMYHGFKNGNVQKYLETNESLHIESGTFRVQMEYLNKHYNVITLDRVIEHYKNGVKIPDNPVVISIDDGYRSIYDRAYPIFKEFSIPATIFLATDFVNNKKLLWIDRIEYAFHMTKSTSLKLIVEGKTMNFDLREAQLKKEAYVKICHTLTLIPQGLREKILEEIEGSLGCSLKAADKVPEIYRPLEWNEVSEMINGGLVSVGSHTVSHVIVTKCDSVTMEEEIEMSKKLIENKTGRCCKMFCYPNGGLGDFNGDSREMLIRAGYEAGLTTIPGMNDRRTDLYELKRLNVNSRVDLVTFIMILSGIFTFFVNFKQAASAVFARKNA